MRIGDGHRIGSSVVGRLRRREWTVASIGQIILGPGGRGAALLGIAAVATLAVVGALLMSSASIEAGARASASRPHRDPTGNRSERRGPRSRWPHLIWSDDFNGPADAGPGLARWSFDTGGSGWGNEELESYTTRPANAELDGHGHLVISARAEKYTGRDGMTRGYTSARLQTLHEFQFKYGLVQARIEVPAGQGLISQFWMLGNNAYEGAGWPDSGEIDTMEVRGSAPHVVEGTLHGPWSWAPHGVSGSASSAPSLAAGFHVYGMEWEPDRISFLLDGSVYQTITPADLPAGASWPFRHPFFLLLDLAVGGVWAGSPNRTTPFPAQLVVDWVRVWQ
jgi:beta-glucanase (GH16 family)